MNLPAAAQLSQEAALQALTEQGILSKHAPPPVRAVQVIAAHGAETSYVFAMLREPEREAILSLDAWELSGPKPYRHAIANIVRNQISKRYQ